MSLDISGINGGAAASSLKNPIGTIFNPLNLNLSSVTALADANNVLTSATANNKLVVQAILGAARTLDLPAAEIGIRFRLVLAGTLAYALTVRKSQIAPATDKISGILYNVATASVLKSSVDSFTITATATVGTYVDIVCETAGNWTVTGVPGVVATACFS